MRLTKHAKYRMRRRGITKADVRRSLAVRPVWDRTGARHHLFRDIVVIVRGKRVITVWRRYA